MTKRGNGRQSTKILALGLAICAAFAGVAAAQQMPCPPGFDSAPALLGLRLGMTPAEVRNVFGRDLKVKVKTRGARTFFQNFIREKATGKLSGVRAIYLRFDDGRLYQIEVFYETGIVYRSLGDLLADFAARNDFSPVLWTIRDNRAEIACGAIRVQADNILNPHIELTDETARLRVAAEREKND